MTGAEHCLKEMDTGEGSGRLPPKRPRTDHLIHCSDEETDSWKTLLRAAQIRRDAPNLDIAKDLPEGKFQQCSTSESVAVSSR